MRISALWLVASVLLASCGGGDGGAETDPALSVRLTNVRIAQGTQRVYEGDRLSDITVSADVTGDIARLNGQTIYVLVEDPSALFNGTPRVSISGNGVDNRVELPAQPTKGRVGSYRSPMRLQVCLDSACKRPIQGSPANLPIDIEVLAGLRFADPQPMVIQLPFGATPTAKSFGVVLPEGMRQVEWEQAPAPRLYDLQATPGSRTSVDITPLLLPVGTYSSQLTVWGYATLDGATRLMSITAPLEIRVQNDLGVPGGFFPPQLANQTYRNAGLNSPIGGERSSLVVVADGSRYTQVSRIVYQPGGIDGSADAGGLEWLIVSVDTVNPRPPQPIRVSVAPAACVSSDGGRTIKCLGMGRYDALVYLKTDDGRELPTPLKVSNEVIY